MAQRSTVAVAAALARGLQGCGPRAGAWAARCRDISSSAQFQHVQTAPAEENAGSQRWQQELGAIRTDWT